jgi:hypothetical protein
MNRVPLPTGALLIDRTSPTIAVRSPAPIDGHELEPDQRDFQRVVTNVDASGSLVNGTPALALAATFELCLQRHPTADRDAIL